MIKPELAKKIKEQRMGVRGCIRVSKAEYSNISNQELDILNDDCIMLVAVQVKRIKCFHAAKITNIPKIMKFGLMSGREYQLGKGVYVFTQPLEYALEYAKNYALDANRMSGTNDQWALLEIHYTGRWCADVETVACLIDKVYPSQIKKAYNICV